MADKELLTREIEEYRVWEFCGILALLYFVAIVFLLVFPVMGAEIQPVLPIENVSVTIPTVDPSAYNTFENVMYGGGNNTTGVDWQRYLYVSKTPWTSQLGSIGYLLLAMIPFMMLWIRQSSTLVPLTLALIFGAFFMGLMPLQWVLVSIVVVLIGIAAIVFGLIKKRS